MDKTTAHTQAWRVKMTRDSGSDHGVGFAPQNINDLRTGQAVLANNTLRRMAEEAAVAQVLDQQLSGGEQADVMLIAEKSGLSADAVARALPQAQAILRRRDLLNGR